MGLVTIQSTPDYTGWPWEQTLTEDEYLEWCRYDDAHPWLSQLPYDRVLDMFLSHYRRGINLNEPPQP